MSRKSQGHVRKRAPMPQKSDKFALPPIPSSQTVCLSYMTSRSIGATSGEILWDFNLNSPYDPDATYSGSQPPYFDQWGEIYRYYRVTDARIEVDAVGVDAYPFELAFAPMGQDPVSAPTEAVAGWRNAHTAAWSPGGPPARVRADVSAAKTYGVSKETVLNDNVFRALFGSSPNQLLYGAVRVRTYGSTDTVYFRVRVTFRIKMEGPDLQLLSATRVVPSGTPGVCQKPTEMVVKLPPSAATAASPATGECKKITARLVEHSEECAAGYSAGKGHSCSH
jgi:hypothetical protein